MVLVAMLVRSNEERRVRASCDWKKEGERVAAQAEWEYAERARKALAVLLARMRSLTNESGRLELAQRQA